MGIVKGFTPPPATNPYVDAVAELLAADEGDAYELVLTPRKTAEGKLRGIVGERTKFQEAARDAGFTARVRDEKQNEDGTISLFFVRYNKQKSPERKSAESATVEPAAK